MAVSPPRPRDLPLTALRAFEAAARLESFADAAAELGVSAGAVTAHVKTLEAALGARLFDRGARGVALTDLGRRVRPDLVAAFDMLGAAAQSLRREAQPQAVHVAALPAVAQLWLSPRLPAIRAAAPDLVVSITAMEAPPNLKRSPYDLCIFYGPEAGDRLADDVIYPVCAPAVAARLERIDDLGSVPCLADATWKDDWRTWLAAAAPGLDVQPRGPVFSLYALAVEEALNGAGVLVGRDALVAGHVRRGDLVAPFPQRAAAGAALRLWTSRAIRPTSPAAALVQWLRANP